MKKIILASAALALSTSAMAGPKWTYADLGYVVGSSVEEDTDGYGIRGSFGFADIWHVRGGYSDFEVQGGDDKGGLDVDGFNAYVGVNPALTENTDFVFEVGYSDFDLGQNDSADGISLVVGLRSMFTDNLELNAFVETSSGDIDFGGGSSEDFTEVRATFGGQYFFTENVGVGVDVSVGGNSSTAAVLGNSANFYARYSF
ncbi:MAG: hypothetical protein V2J12_02465 [Gammaproteobacteria bacterium]|jgi:hypothetical protein|nr:hypothetical protein [Gammaproteobacteria bacterium]